MTAKDYLLVALAIMTVFFLVVVVGSVTKARAKAAGAGEAAPSLATIVVGFVTNFFDTFGIGSFATTTAIFRRWKMIRDEHIPGTLNAGHTLPTVVQAVIFTRIVPVDSRTLILMIAAAVSGAWLGAGFVARWPRARIQLGMGVALIAAACLILAALFKLIPAGGDALALHGGLLILGVAGNFSLGVLMTLGIGLYAPCLILVSLLGMNPIAAFPIMMGSCAFLMPVASARFIKAESYDLKATLGLAVGGVPAVLAAAYIINSLLLGEHAQKTALTVIRSGVVVVVLYTAVGLLLAARRERSAPTSPTGGVQALP